MPKLPYTSCRVLGTMLLLYVMRFIAFRYLVRLGISWKERSCCAWGTAPRGAKGEGSGHCASRWRTLLPAARLPKPGVLGWCHLQGRAGREVGGRAPRGKELGADKGGADALAIAARHAMAAVLVPHLA
jgi:hypothetical protein